MANPIEEALELVLTDVEWYHKSPTKRVIIKALTALQSGELVVVSKKDILILTQALYEISSCDIYNDSIWKLRDNARKSLQAWKRLQRREEESDAQ